MVDEGELGLHPETEKLVPPPRKIDPELSDRDAFESAMNGVAPLGWSDTPLKLPPPPEIPVWTGGSTGDDDDVEIERRVLAELEAFVEGRGEMDPFATGDGVEGASSLRARRLLPSLKKGDFAVQDELDLHGLALTDAKAALERFLKHAQQRSISCVRVVHGRGQHSPSEPHALKRAVTRWLTSRKLRRIVVAFASARWRDGGSGAVYVLLFGKWGPAQR